MMPTNLRNAPITLLDVLLASHDKDPTSTPAIVASGKISLYRPSYARLVTPPATLLRQIAVEGGCQPAASLEASDDSAATTDINLTLAYDTVSTTSNRAGLNLKKVFGLLVQVDFYGSAGGRSTMTVTWVAEDGDVLTQVVRVDYPAGGDAGARGYILLLPGMDVENEREYKPATTAVEHIDSGAADTVAAARTITVDMTNVPNNTKAFVRGFTASHEDIRAIRAFMAAVDAQALAGARSQLSPSNDCGC